MVEKDRKYTVLGIDKCLNEDWLHGEYDTAEEALRVARRLTKKYEAFSESCDISMIFYAYAPDGKCLQK
ncbi:hypothetical protein HZA33_04705 [Candidatus Pacearchaeota archaeon]|nr:hypothetical protein [Candidatus Pacearchaeota archaeon]